MSTCVKCFRITNTEYTLCDNCSKHEKEFAQLMAEYQEFQAISGCDDCRKKGRGDKTCLDCQNKFLDNDGNIKKGELR